jgi:hypothetical protein
MIRHSNLLFAHKEIRPNCFVCPNIKIHVTLPRSPLALRPPRMSKSPKFKICGNFPLESEWNSATWPKSEVPLDVRIRNEMSSINSSFLSRQKSIRAHWRINTLWVPYRIWPCALKWILVAGKGPYSWPQIRETKARGLLRRTSLRRTRNWAEGLAGIWRANRSQSSSISVRYDFIFIILRLIIPQEDRMVFDLSGYRAQVLNSTLPQVRKQMCLRQTKWKKRITTVRPAFLISETAMTRWLSIWSMSAQHVSPQ